MKPNLLSNLSMGPVAMIAVALACLLPPLLAPQVKESAQSQRIEYRPVYTASLVPMQQAEPTESQGEQLPNAIQWDKFVPVGFNPTAEPVQNSSRYDLADVETGINDIKDLLEQQATKTLAMSDCTCNCECPTTEQIANAVVEKLRESGLLTLTAKSPSGQVTAGPPLSAEAAGIMLNPGETLLSVDSVTTTSRPAVARAFRPVQRVLQSANQTCRTVWNPQTRRYQRVCTGQ